MAKVHINWIKVNEGYKYNAIRGEDLNGYWMDNILKNNLDLLKQSVKRKWDGTFLITGMEGSGKSNAAFMCANYLDPTFQGEEALRRIVFTADQFYKIVDTAKPETSIVWDEMVLGGMSDDALTNMQKALIKKFTLLRKKRLYLILVIPYIFMLRLYFAVARTRFVMHFYSPDGLERGFFKFYSYDKKRELYFKGKKNYWNMNVVPADFIGQTRNTEGYFFDDAEYQKKKDSANLVEEEKKKVLKESDRAKRIRIQRDHLIATKWWKRAGEKPKITESEFVDSLNRECPGFKMTKSNFSTLLSDHKEYLRLCKGSAPLDFTEQG